MSFLRGLFGTKSADGVAESLSRLRYVLERGDWSDAVRHVGPWVIPLQPTSLAKSLHSYFASTEETSALSLFGSGEANFPNGEALAKLLVRINKNDWLSPKQIPDEIWLQERIEEACARFQIGRKTLWLFTDKHDFLSQRFDTSILPTWHAAIESAADAITTSASRTRRTPSIDILFAAMQDVLTTPLSRAADAAFTNIDHGMLQETLATQSKLSSGEMPRELARRELRDKGYIRGASEQYRQAFLANTTEIAQLAMAWVAVEDVLQPRENPFISLIDILDRGAWPFSPVKDRFVVFWPSE